MNIITLRAGDSYSLTTGKVTRTPDAVVSRGTESLESPLSRSLRRNDPRAFATALRTV